MSRPETIVPPDPPSRRGAANEGTELLEQIDEKNKLTAGPETESKCRRSERRVH